jgi:Glycosyl hydrolase family 26
MAVLLALLVAFLVAGCSAGGVASLVPEPTGSQAASTIPSGPQTLRPVPSPSPGMARLEPADGAYFGLNLDWGSQTAAAASDALGVRPAVWVQFARFPLDTGARANLDAFVAQVADLDGMALITLEPHDGLDKVTEEAVRELADLLATYWTDLGVPTFVRFAHEMNGSWYPWGQQPDAYVLAFRRVAEAVHERSPASAMVWAPNEGNGYPFRDGAFKAEAGSPAADALDTDGDGQLSESDDPYAPYYPGDEAVDWVGMSLYHWGLEYPWGENELPPDGAFAALLRGRDDRAQATGASIPDFYATYAEGHDKPLAIVETAILYDPAATDGPTESELKEAWFHQVFSRETGEAFPRIGMLSWFEWRKEEPEVGRVIDWRLGSDPARARRLLDEVPEGWLRFAGQ